MSKSETLVSHIAQSQYDPFVKLSVNSGSVHGIESYTPTTGMCAMAAMMSIITSRRQKPASTNIEITGSMSPDELLFANFVNGIESDAAPASGLPNFSQTVNHVTPDACSQAEMCFGAILRGKTLKEKEMELGPVLAFHEEGDDRPLLIQKFIGIDTALGLRKISIDNIEYPAGTLYSLYSDPGHRLHTKHRVNLRDPGKLSIRHISTSKIQSIAPVRPTLLAFNPEERPRMSDQEIADSRGFIEKFDAKVLNSVHAFTVNDFSDAFRKRYSLRTRLANLIR